jgi:repressor LexA
VGGMTCKDGVRWCRKRLGLTKAQLAQKLGLSDVAVGYWESGATTPTHRHIQKLCDLTGITVSRFWALNAKASA